MGFKPVPDVLCHHYSPALTYRTALDSNFDGDDTTLDLNNNDDDDDAAVKTVTIVNVQDLSELQRPPTSSFGGVNTERTSTSVQRSMKKQQLRGAIGRMYLTGGGVSYLLPANETKISVNNVYKPCMAKTFDKQLRVKERALLNHRRGVVSAGDTPRHCVDISALRMLNGACLDSDRHAHRTLFEFLTKNSARVKYVDELDVADIRKQRVVLPGSALSDRGPLRRRWMAINPKVKTMVGGLGQPNLQRPVPWPSEHALEMMPYVDMSPAKSRIKSGVPNETRMGEMRRQRVQKWVQEVKLPNTTQQKNEILQQAMTRIIARKWSRVSKKKPSTDSGSSANLARSGEEGPGRGRPVNIEIKIN